MTQTLI